MAEKLYLGTGREVITPRIGTKLYGYDDKTISTAVHDDLYASSIYLKTESTKALIINLNLCNAGNEISDTIRSTISAKYDIPFENILLHCMHTHTGPAVSGSYGWGNADESYVNEIFLPKLYASVDSALAHQEEVKIGISCGESKIGINRRERNSENKIILGQRENGEFDSKMVIISFKNSANKTICNMIHYACHGTCAGHETLIGRDFAGIMCDELEKISGGMTVFMNGAEGDIGPRISNGRTIGDISHVEELGKKAAKDAIRIYKSTEEYKNADIKVISGYMRFPLKKRISIEEAESILAGLNKTRSNVTGKTADYCERVIASHKNGYHEKEYRDIPQTILKIGDAAFIAYPYEPFSRLATEINANCPIPHVLALSNTNGHEGYFPTADEIPFGGYEIRMFLYNNIQQYSDDADKIFISETLRNLKGVL